MIDTVAKPNIPSLTGLRFYAAAIIAYCHSLSYYFQPLNSHTLINTEALGSIGMTLFFVLSGFVIHYNYGDSLAQYRSSSIWSFAVARFARLYPLYILALALTLAFIPNPYAGDQLWNAWPFYVTLTQDWLPSQIDGKPLSSLYVGQAWSISAEVLLYFLYIPLARAICALRSSRSTLVIIGIFLVLATGFNLGRMTGHWMRDGWDQYYDFYQSPYCRFPEFLLGALVATLYQKREKLPTAWCERATLLYGSLAIMIALFAGSYCRYGHLFLLFESSWGYAPTCGGLIYYFARNRGHLSWVVESKPVILFGDASYGVYMLNNWSLWMFSSNGVSPNYSQATFRMVMAWIFMAFLCLGSYQYFEVPARRFIRRVANGRKRPKSSEKLEIIVEAEA